MEKVQRLVEEKIQGIPEDKDPVAILIGGLPGAGKTNLVKKIMEENPEKSFVVIDSDDFRKHTPNITELMKTTPQDAVNHSIMFANMVEEELIKAAIDRGISFISVTSLRATDALNDLICIPARKKGFRFEIAAMVARIDECLLTTQMRYEEQIDKGQFPRYVTRDYMHLAYTGMLRSLDYFSKQMPIKLYKRGKGEDSLPVNVFDSTKNLAANMNMSAIYNMCTQRSLGEKEFLQAIQKLRMIKEGRNADKLELDDLDDLEKAFDSDRQK